MWPIIWREVKLHYTKPYWLISNFTSPLFYLFFFGLLFSRAMVGIPMAGKNIQYLHFFIPGLIVMQSFFIFSTTLALVNLDRRTRVIDMINMTATSFFEYFLGRMVSVQGLTFMKSLLLWLVAVILFGFTVIIPMTSVLVVLFVFLISNFLWFGMGFILGLVIRTEDVRDIVAQLLILPLSFLSTIYYPAQNAPGILKIIIAANPLTHAANIIRPALLGIGNGSVRSLYVLLVYLAVVMIILAYFIRRWSATQEK
jgi:ABC-type multidrug transport system permease subunit